MTEDFDVNDIREQLRLRFESTAYWRREKAKEYPDDERNAEAAAHLEHLATTVDSVPDQKLAAYAELYDERDTEEENEMFRVVGFYSLLATATEFVDDLISRCTGGA